MSEMEYTIDGDDIIIDLYVEGRWVTEVKVDKLELLLDLGARAIENHDDLFTFENHRIEYPNSDNSFIYSEYDITKDDIENYLNENKILWQAY